MRHFLPIVCLALVAACKPQMSADIYAGDILEVAETGKSLEMPVRMGLPIQDEKKCGENKDKMLLPGSFLNKRVLVFGLFAAVAGEERRRTQTTLELHICVWKLDQS